MASDAVGRARILKAAAIAALVIVGSRTHALAARSLPKALVACQAAVDAAGSKFVVTKLGRLAKCTNAVLQCIQNNPQPGTPERAECLQKVQSACAKQLTALKDPAKGDEVKARAMIEKACGPEKVAPNAVLTVFAGAAETCAELDIPLLDAGDVAQCVVHRHECEAEELFAREVPRASELLGLGGVSLTTLPCLPSISGTEQGLTDAAQAKAVLTCQKAIQKAANKFLQQDFGRLGKCAVDIFKCSQIAPGNQECVAKASGKCVRATDKAQDAVKGDAAKLQQSIGKACGATKIQFASVLSPDGIGFARLFPSVSVVHRARAAAAAADPCSGFTQSVAGIGSCLQQQFRTSAVALLSQSFPAGGGVLDDVCRQSVAIGDIAAAADVCSATADIDPTQLQARLLGATGGGLAAVLGSSQFTQLAVLFGADLSGSASNICQVALSHPGTLPPGAPTGATIQQALQPEGLALIEHALQQLAAIPPDAVITFDLHDLPPCIQSLDSTVIEIDQGDILALRALLELLAGTGHAGVAYDIDADLAALVNGTATFEEVFLADPQLLTLLAPAGSGELATARDLLASAAGDLLAAVDFIGAEIDDQSNDVLVVDPEDTADVARMRAVTARLQAALSGEVVFEASAFPELTTDQRLTLVPVFDGNVGSLRPFVPGFDDRGRPDACQFGDPTFGGLAPDGTQEELAHLVCP